MLADWLRQETVIVEGGRRFVCRPPTVRTITLALSAFAPLIRMLARQWAESDTPWDEAATERLLAVMGKDPQSTAILASCVTLHGAAPGDFEEAVRSNDALRCALFLACAKLIDGERAWAEVQCVLEESPSGDGGNPDAGLLAMARLAGLHPLDLFELPYGLYLSLRDIAHPQTDEDAADNIGTGSLDDLARRLG